MGFLSRETFITCWSGGRVQVWVQVRALPLIWPGQSWSLFRKTKRKFCLQNQWPSSWGSAPARLGQVGLASTNTGPWVFPSRLQSPLAATGSLEEKVLPLLLCWLTLRFKKVSMICKFRKWRRFFFFVWNEIFNRRFYYQVIPTKAALIASLNLSIIHWSLGKISAHEQAACCELNPVQYTRP